MGSLAEPDRQRFVAAFQRLSVMTYAARFKAVGPDTFRAVDGRLPPMRAGACKSRRPSSARVRPTSRSSTCCKQDAQGWRIINIVADGVSDLALKRAEYQRVFASGGIDGLIAELEQQTQRLAQQLSAAAASARSGSTRCLRR